MLYTRRGDAGTTKTFGCDQRISKSSAIAEALGTLDEINSLLGVCKVKAGQGQDDALTDVLAQAQQNLFTIQAELAGADKHLIAVKVTEVEKVIDDIEKQLPPIRSFFVAGGSELAAHLDYARAVARRAERRVIGASADRQLGEAAMAYLNRLSSLLYALARLANHQSGIKEESPRYD